MCNLLFSLAHAKITIVKVFEAATLSDNFMTLFLDNGEIVHINKDDKRLIEQVNKHYLAGKRIQLTKISHDQNQPDLVVAIEELPDDSISVKKIRKEMYSPYAYNSLAFSTSDPLEKANISTLDSYQEAQSIMDKLRSDTSDDSQCYNRAHVWTYETLVNSQTTLGKTWIFFTQKYIKEFTYKWWFHVAPYTLVKDANQTYVLDRGFSLIPYNLVNWKNLFMRNQADCPVITNYLDYETQQDSAYCYLIFSSQYYWQPYQLKNLSTKTERTWGYRKSNLTIAYEDAITNWDERMPELESTTTTLPGYIPSRRETYPEEGPVVRTEARVETSLYYPSIRVRFNKGSEVIDESYRTGKIIGLLDRNEVLIEYDNSNYQSVVPLSSLGLKVDSFLSYKRGIKMIDENRNLGEIKELYSNGVALIDYEEYRDGYVRLSNRIGYELRQSGRFTRGQSIIDSSNNTGHIKRIYSNGFILFDKDGTRTNYVISIQDISYEVSTLRGYRSGTKVIYGNLLGEVKTIFASGQIYIDFDSRQYRDGIVRIEQLAMEVGSAQGFSRGNSVIYQGNFLGKIERIYSNGLAFINFQDRRYSDGLVNLVDLRKVR